MSVSTAHCEHGYPAWKRTRTSESVCPICRRTQREQTRANRARSARYAQPVLDVAMLKAGEDNDEPLAPVVSISAARRRKWTRP